MIWVTFDYGKSHTTVFAHYIVCDMASCFLGKSPAESDFRKGLRIRRVCFNMFHFFFLCTAVNRKSHKTFTHFYTRKSGGERNFYDHMKSFIAVCMVSLRAEKHFLPPFVIVHVIFDFTWVAQKWHKNCKRNASMGNLWVVEFTCAYFNIFSCLY